MGGVIFAEIISSSHDLYCKILLVLNLIRTPIFPSKSLASFNGQRSYARIYPSIRGPYFLWKNTEFGIWFFPTLVLYTEQIILHWSKCCAWLETLGSKLNSGSNFLKFTLEFIYLSWNCNQFNLIFQVVKKFVTHSII